MGARVLVAGARVTGMSAARFLADLGAQVIVTDSAPSQLQALAATPLNGAVQLVAGLEAPPPGTDLVVLYVDKDYELIAEVTGQLIERLAITA